MLLKLTERGQRTQSVLMLPTYYHIVQNFHGATFSQIGRKAKFCAKNFRNWPYRSIGRLGNEKFHENSFCECYPIHEICENFALQKIRTIHYASKVYSKMYVHLQRRLSFSFENEGN